MMLKISITKFLPKNMIHLKRVNRKKTFQPPAGQLVFCYRKVKTLPSKMTVDAENRK